MNKQSKINTASKIALFGASIIWGSSFLVVKSSMDSMQPHTLLAIRFTIGSLLLCLIFYKKLKQLNRDYLIRGGILGIFLFLAYSIQTIGITGTTPGKNAFLTAIYCVIVPYLYWIVYKKRPEKHNIIAAILCLTGIGLVSVNNEFKIQMGDAFSMISGFFYAAHIVAISKLAKNRDPVLLTIVQFCYSAVISWVVTLLFEDLPSSLSPAVIGELLYLAIFATAIALLLQNIGQKYTKPAQASIILSLEAIFGVIFSVIFFKEEISLKLFIGFLLIFLAVLTSERAGYLKKQA